MIVNACRSSIDVPEHGAVIRLGAGDVDGVIEHLRALDHDDRQWRFGTPLTDEAIVRYVERIEFARDAVLAVPEPGGALMALAHIARAGTGAEIGLSVLAHRRRCGLGLELVHRAAHWARRAGLREMWLQGHRENVGILAVAARAGMRTEPHGADVIARLPLTHVPDGHAAEAGRTCRWTASRANAAGGLRAMRALRSRCVEAVGDRRDRRTDTLLAARGPRRSIAGGH